MDSDSYPAEDSSRIQTHISSCFNSVINNDKITQAWIISYHS